MLLNKKVFKILSVLVAVIIAFCCSAISASAATINDFYTEIVFVVAVYDDSGNIIDEILVPVEDIKFNSIKDFYYFDVAAPLGYKFFMPDCYTVFSVYSPTLSSEYYVFSFSSGVSVVPSSSSGFFNVDGFLLSEIGVSATGSIYESAALLTSNRQLSTLSFSFAPAEYEFVSDGLGDSGGLKVYGPILQPGMFDFFSNMNIFFNHSVSWFSSIFKNLVLKPSILVLSIGFIVVGFVFSLLHRLIRSH